MNLLSIRARRVLPVLLSLSLSGAATLAADPHAPEGPSAGYWIGGRGPGRGPAPATSPDLEAVRRRVIAEFMEPMVDEGRVAHLVESLGVDGAWPDIDYEDVSRTAFEHRRHVTNLVEMSRAYSKPGSGWYRRPELKRAITSALDFWIRHDFIGENWHSNEIANPGQWTRVLLMLDSELTESHARELVRMAGRANLHAWGARPGGDLIKIAGIMAERALFERDEDALEIALGAMAAEINFTTGNGLKPDFSFNHRQDRVMSVLSYGTGYASAFADWARRLAGTRHQFPERSLAILIDFFLDGITGATPHGRFPDPGAKNRAISRRSELSPLGPELPRSLLAASSHRKDELERIVRIRSGEQAPDMAGNRFFWHIEYLSHQRPEYFTSVRMYSARNHNMEYPYNSESLKHHHYADGANFISRTGDEYRDIFPVWDWQKIPGTTVVQKPVLPGVEEIVKQGRTDFVGAVSDGVHGAAAFDFESPHDPLTARKSWFFFDDEWVALGSGIHSSSEHPVATTLNQALSRGDVVVGTSAGRLVLEKGEHEIEDLEWVSHDGVAYLFPAPTAARLENRVRHGAWREITHQAWARALDEEAREEVFTLWLDHGRRPRGATYEYIVVPGLEPADVETYRRAAGVRVLANTPEIQAVGHERLGLSQIVFYEAGRIALPGGRTLSVGDPGLVMVQGSGVDLRRISVSDPTRRLKSFQLRVDGRVEGSGEEWKATWNQQGGYSEIRVRLPGGAYAGRSVALDLDRPGFTGSRSDAATPSSGSATDAAQPSPGGGGEKRFVGERYGGGVVFWVDEDGTTGLVAATTDQSEPLPWSRGHATTTHAHATADGVGGGERNTLLIHLARAANEPRPSAAKACLDYRGAGFKNWYLPSRAELDLMYRRREDIGGFANDMYWSSTEYNVGFAWEQYFYGYGGQYTTPKGSSSRVRCIRRF